MNWSLFLLNQLLEDVVTSEAGEHNISYSWLLNLISLVTWMEPEDYQPMLAATEKVCKGAHY